MQKNSDGKIVLSGMNEQELEQIAALNNQPLFRAKQLKSWLYNKSASTFDEMTNLSKDFRAKLKETAVISDTEILQKLEGKDGTIKYLLKYPDGSVVETVLMRFDNRPNLTACVSSQVGCAVGCIFCATGKRGFIRNLTAGEIVDQILTIQRDSGKTVTNVVYMGQGEPLLNFDEVMKSVKFLNNELEIGSRRITISTCGIIPGIMKFADENRQLTLALSLHAPNHELRAKLIPIENRYPLDKIMEALKYLTEKTGRRVTIEYILIDKINDEIHHSKELLQLIKNLKCNINLIPYNPVKNSNLKCPSPQRIEAFKEIIMKSPKKVTLRLERGAGISAACGQLSGEYN